MVTLERRRTAHPVWGGRLDVYVTTIGSGPDIVYLPPTGLTAVDPFVETLASRYTVHAIEFPGSSPEQPDAAAAIGGLWDLVLILEEVVRSLALERPGSVGVSVGAMLAAELAASFPQLFSSLVLVSPLGIWRDDEPTSNWQASVRNLTPLLFHDPQSPEALAAVDPQGEQEEVIALRAGQIWSLGCIGRFIWPFPERGLAGRLHRIAVPTLVVRGAADEIVPERYAETLTDAIAQAELVTIPGSKHLPSIERSQQVLQLVPNSWRSTT